MPRMIGIARETLRVATKGCSAHIMARCFLIVVARAQALQV